MLPAVKHREPVHVTWRGMPISTNRICAVTCNFKKNNIKSSQERVYWHEIGNIVALSVTGDASQFGIQDFTRGAGGSMRHGFRDVAVFVAEVTLPATDACSFSSRFQNCNSKFPVELWAVFRVVRLKQRALYTNATCWMSNCNYSARRYCDPSCLLVRSWVREHNYIRAEYL